MSLLGGQFLADIEHICLGSVSYDSDEASSSATSRSVESIISDAASLVSDGSRGCRPRITKRVVAKNRRSHSFKEPQDSSHAACQDSIAEGCNSDVLPVMTWQCNDQAVKCSGDELEWTKSDEHITKVLQTNSHNGDQVRK